MTGHSLLHIALLSLTQLIFSDSRLAVLILMCDCFDLLLNIVYNILHYKKVEFGTGLVMSSFPICRKHPMGIIKIGDNVAICNKMS